MIQPENRDEWAVRLAQSSRNIKHEDLTELRG